MTIEGTSNLIHSEKIKNIFVDLDETLIHTNLTNGDMPNEIPEEQVTLGKETYQVSLRPGARELLFKLRELGHVFMLTRATHDYAIAMDKHFNLAFSEDRIYSRKDVQLFRYKELHLPKGKCYLIDDLSQINNYEKVALINQLGPTYYIRVNPFYGFKEEALTNTDINNIIGSIKKE
jgi:hypothetical protein